MSDKSAPIGVGVVGIGDVAQRTYLPFMQPFREKFRFAGFCDSFRDRAEEMARKYGAEACHDDYQEMLGNPNVEAVLVLTSNDVHYSYSRAALEAGKHVYVEKTAGQNAGEVADLIQQAEKRGLVLACAPAIIMAPVIAMLRETLKSGALGRVCFARCQTRGLGPAGGKVRVTDSAWFYGPTCGPFPDRGVYLLHILIDAFGPVKRVTALQGIAIPRNTVASGPTTGRTVQTTTPDNIHMILDFGDAVFATVDMTFCSPATRSADIEIYGAEGALALDWHLKKPTFSVYSRETDMWEDRAPGPWGLEHGVESFLDSIRAGAPLPYPAEHARHAIEVMDAANQSADEGRTIEIASHR